MKVLTSYFKEQTQTQVAISQINVYQSSLWGIDNNSFDKGST